MNNREGSSYALPMIVLNLVKLGSGGFTVLPHVRVRTKLSLGIVAATDLVRDTVVHGQHPRHIFVFASIPWLVVAMSLLLPLGADLAYRWPIVGVYVFCLIVNGPELTLAFCATFGVAQCEPQQRLRA